MKHQIPHDLEPGLAKVVASRAFEAYRTRFAEYEPRMSWVGDGDAEFEFHVKGMKLRGGINLLPRAFELHLDVPFVFRLFKNRAIEIIDREVRFWIQKAKSGELAAPSPRDNP